MEGINKFWKNVEQRTKGLIPVQVFPAVVKEVDEDLRTCTVRVNDSVDFEDVRLYAVADADLKGFFMIPAKDSHVMVGRIGNSNELYVAMFSEVDKVVGTVGDKVEFALDGESFSYKNDKTEITVKADEIAAKIDKVEFEVKGNEVTLKADSIYFNDGKSAQGNGGLVNVDGLTGQLNAIEDDINNLKNAVSLWVPTPQDGGAGLKVSLASWFATPLTKSTNNNYEDTKVKH